MPDKDFSRVSARGRRSVGQAPNIGKVPRSPQSATRRASSRKSRNGGTSLKKSALLWTVAFGSVALVGLVVFIVVFYFGRARVDSVVSNKQVAPVHFIETRTSILETLGEDEAVKLVRSALNLTDPGQVDDHFILTAPREPAEVLQLLGEYRESFEIESLIWLGGRFVNRGYLEEVLVTYKNSDRVLNHLAQFWKEPDGAWKIDFDSYARHVSPDWPSILSGEATVSIVRIFISEDNYYNGAFRDEEKWQSYSLVSPDIEEILFAYVLRTSPQHTALIELLQAEESAHPATLELTKLPDSAPRQFQISRVLAENWSIRPQAFDEAR